jgi:threonine synthase
MENLRYSFVSGLRCSRCGREADHLTPQTVCTFCGATLFAEYDIGSLAERLSKDSLSNRVHSMWRYHELLPVKDPQHVVTLGEGMTPVLKSVDGRLAAGVSELLVKDDGLMPTGTFKARGMSSAISRGIELGLRDYVLASAGNAGGAAAMYAARAGVKAHVFVPKDAPIMNLAEMESSGADVVRVEGLIDKAGVLASNESKEKGWFNLSTMKEPYRVEGKKTMGLEISEQLGWTLPDIIIYPTGGGTGLVGMWKAFNELEEMGWIGSNRPRMVAVQAEGCQPVVRAFESGAEEASPFPNPKTIASGLRVPAPFASEQILKVIRESRGCAIAVQDSEILSSMRRFHRTGVFVCPEGAATLAALDKLSSDHWLDRNERVLLYNTGTCYKYGEYLTH